MLFMVSPNEAYVLAARLHRLAEDRVMQLAETRSLLMDVASSWTRLPAPVADLLEDLMKPDDTPALLEELAALLYRFAQTIEDVDRVIAKDLA